ncbi:probable purine permease 10 [Durio zibethinus]|uniref:Probable purine permease n=1 Tax=Durio zibethinus TaxID=66656 RepID=A0A6P5X961_DURZI|nr:probable purine permease 10 [Durio zibethinus]
MAEAQQIQVPVKEAKGENSSTGPVSQRTMSGPAQNYMIRMLRIALYTIFVLCGQTSASLLTRLYYEKGGTSTWVETIVQVVGFPILLPYYFISQPKVMCSSNDTTTAVGTKPSSLLLLVCVYVYLGLLSAGNSYLYSVGFQYLPVSMVVLISATQLAFNAFFSYFLNSQKFTPFIINSLFLLTISSVLLVANNSSERPPGVSIRNYVLGFICTIFATATSGLSLASQQLVFRKVLKRQSFKVVMDLIIFQSLVASIATSIGFFASGDWKLLKTEMDGYALGKVSYVMTLVWTAVAWQVFIFGGVALVFELSALFSNVIAALGLPITPIAAIFIFHDKMSAPKGISMVLAIWGVISYAYQQYLDDRQLNTETKRVSEVSEV